MDHYGNVKLFFHLFCIGVLFFMDFYFKGHY